MNRKLRYTLLSDGSSDSVLLHIVDWLLRLYLPSHDCLGKWADLRDVPINKSLALSPLARKLYHAVTTYPCELLFIHRDAEKQGRQQRVDEIQQAIKEVQTKLAITVPVSICLIPVRMQEAWLLIDETAIRRAAGNPNGRMKLDLPGLHDVEFLPDPKDVLHRALKQASGLSSTRLRKFSPEKAVYRIFIEDWSPLRELSAFQALEADIQQLIEDQGWNN